jgi:hypothetical protein
MAESTRLCDSARSYATASRSWDQPAPRAAVGNRGRDRRQKGSVAVRGTRPSNPVLKRVLRRDLMHPGMSIRDALEFIAAYWVDATRTLLARKDYGGAA